MSAGDDFYIGYEPVMPEGLRRAVRAALAVTFVTAIAAASVFVSQQRRLAESRFEFGNPRWFEGYLTLSPAPSLLIDDGEGTRPFWLVSTGKFGAGAALGAAAPGWVRAKGTLIARERWRMIELVPGSLERAADRAAPPLLPAAASRSVVLRGEVVDSKCFLGVMNPGERVVHRDCAIRCLAGDVPAMFAFRDGSGSRLALVTGVDAQAARALAGRTVTLAGSLAGSEDALIFAVSMPPTRE